MIIPYGNDNNIVFTKNSVIFLRNNDVYYTCKNVNHWRNITSMCTRRDESQVRAHNNALSKLDILLLRNNVDNIQQEKDKKRGQRHTVLATMPSNVVMFSPLCCAANLRDTSISPRCVSSLLSKESTDTWQLVSSSRQFGLCYGHKKECASKRIMYECTQSCV